MSFNQTLISIQNIVSELIRISLCDSQNFPTTTDDGKHRCISFAGENYASIALSSLNYLEIYKELNEKRAFTVKLLDGALLQLQYEFDRSKDVVTAHRLAFFPKIDTVPYVFSPDDYSETDLLFKEIFEGVVILSPIRFDFKRNEIAENHPHSHLTLGQIKDCRIPVSSPISPGEFIEFIISSYYPRTKEMINSKIFENSLSREDFLTSDHKKLFHVMSPNRKISFIGRLFK